MFVVYDGPSTSEEAPEAGFEQFQFSCQLACSAMLLFNKQNTQTATPSEECPSLAPVAGGTYEVSGIERLPLEQAAFVAFFNLDIDLWLEIHFEVGMGRHG